MSLFILVSIRSVVSILRSDNKAPTTTIYSTHIGNTQGWQEKGQPNEESLFILIRLDNYSLEQR